MKIGTEMEWGGMEHGTECEIKKFCSVPFSFWFDFKILNLANY